MTINRVDHVGSLLRPESLKGAFMRHATNQLTREELETVQDAAIREIVARQEAHGLPVVTDGEYRRLNWQVSFSDVAGWDMWNTSWMNFRQNPENRAPTETPFQKGEDAVLDCLLLSRCQVLIRTASNLSQCSALINPDVPEIALNRGY